MRLFDLFEDKLKTAVIGFGRMNPPTTGHGVLVNAINSKAKAYGGDPMLFLSMTHTPFLTDKTQKLRPWDKIKNPLQWKQKLEYAQKFFDIPISTDPSLNTIMSVMKHLETKGYEKVVLVCGSDRVKEFETQILPYNNTPDQSGNIAFNIKEVSVEEGGFRDEEADDASGMSASKMREAAANNDFESFKQGVPVESLAKKMFDDVRQGLGMNHQTEDANQDQEDKFHVKLDKLVHKTFGHSSDEKKKKKKKTDEVFGFATTRPKTNYVVKKRPPEDEESVQDKVKRRRALASKVGVEKAFTGKLPKQKNEAKEKQSPVIKPRDPNWRDMEALRKSGAMGAHKDKKRDQKIGYQKHKGKQLDMNSIAEGYLDMEVMGHKYMPDIEDYDDNRKIWHTIVTPQGKTVDADFTPYEYMDKEDLKLFIKLGYPKRQGAGPLNKEELQKMAQSVGVAKLDPEMANAGKKESQDDLDWGSMSKKEFKRRELDHELGHEDEMMNYEVQINGKPWKVFPNKQQANKAASTIQMKYGKETKVYATMKRPSQ
jgi:hypothetical protein